MVIISSFEPLDTLNGWNTTAEFLLRVNTGSEIADAECFDNRTTITYSLTFPFFLQQKESY